MSAPLPGELLPSAPHSLLRSRLLALADAWNEDGSSARAEELRGLVEAWWADQLRWDERVGQLLSVHHEINNALVGVRGNTQLLMLGPAAQVPGVRERLEVVIRESGRIRDAAIRLQELKAAMHGPGTNSRAA